MCYRIRRADLTSVGGDEHAIRLAPVGDARQTRQPAPADLERQPITEPLTARELEIVQLVSEGLSNKEIAGRLYVAEETVKAHIRHLLPKLRARSRAHAVAIAFRHGLIA
jgi:DNA-binding NarL/FixJ family response regulator